jgi:hypothetical protein
VGTGLVLRNNGGDDLTVNASGSFTFSSPLADGAAYNVTIQSAPAGHNCTASNSAATIAGANVTNIQIQCSVSLTLGFGIKQLRFSWPTVNGALEYRLLQNPDGASGFTLLRTLAANATSTTVDVAVYRQDWSNARYLLQACNATTCSDSNEVNTAGAALQAVGYFKASNNKFLYRFGQSVAVSADGTTLAVGTIFEPSNATGINGDQSNDTAQMAGAVYVFARSGDTWSQQAYVKASNTGGFDQFGAVVSLSKDGNTLAVGAPLEDSASSDQANNAATDAGAVYVFTRSENTWSQQAYVKASNPGDKNQFGTAIALSSDDNTLAMRTFGETSASNVINGDQTDNTASRAGAIYVYARSGSSWNQQAYLKASNAEAFDELGVSVALSENGDTLAAGALGEASGTGSASDNSLPNAGAVYVFVRSGITWTQQAYLKASNIDSGDLYAWAVALSSDGNTLAVSAPGEASAATGINGNQADNSTPSGAVYVYTRTANIWTQQAYVKASNTGSGDDFGTSITLSGDGDTLAVGAPGEASSAVGLNDGNQADNSATSAGAVYLYTRSGGAWSQSTYIKASNTDANDHFGVSVGLSADGNTLAVGATGESGSSAGVGGNQSDNSFTAAGAAYLY